MLRAGGETRVAWKDIVAGDLIVVHDKDELPADIVLVATSEELAKCFIEVRLGLTGRTVGRAVLMTIECVGDGAVLYFCATDGELGWGDQLETARSGEACC